MVEDAKERRGCLVRVKTGDLIETFNVKEETFVIGRDPSSHVHVNHFEVSRKHVMVQVVGGKVRVRDMGSANGTFIGDRQLRPDEQATLQPEDQGISLGVIARVTFEPAPAEAQTEELPSLPRKNAIKLHQEAEQEAVRIREEAYRRGDEELREQHRMIQELTPRRAELERMVSELSEQSSKLTETCIQVEDRQRQAEEIIERLEKRREEMELGSVELAKAIQAAKDEREILNAKIEPLRQQIAASEAELAALGEKVRRESENLETETRRQHALNEATVAECRVKRLELEATIRETELQQLEARKKLQDILGQAHEAELKVAEEHERLEGTLRKTQEAAEELSMKRQELEDAKAELAARRQSIAELAQAEASARTQVAELERARDVEIEAETSDRRKKMEEIFVTRGVEMERELADAKLRELEKIKGLEAETQQRERYRRQFVLDEIVRSAQALSRQGPLEEESFRKVVEAALDGKSTGNLNAEHARKTRAFWRKAGMYVALAAGIAAFFILVPGIPQALKHRLGRAIASDQKESGGAFLAEIRENGLKYEPPQDTNYRDSYSDNILYLRGYVDMKRDPDEKKRWTLALNDFIVGRLGLSDRVLPGFISAESVMISDLLQVREGILLEYRQQGIDRMADEEAKDLPKLATQLETPENYRKFREFEKSFYEDYLARKTRAANAMPPSVAAPGASSAQTPSIIHKFN